MTHAPNMDYPMLVGAGIQGARITFQGAQLRAPVTFQGFGQLFPDGIDIPIPTLPPGVIQAVAAIPAPQAPQAPSPLASNKKLLVGAIVAGSALLAVLLLR